MGATAKTRPAGRIGIEVCDPFSRKDIDTIDGQLLLDARAIQSRALSVRRRIANFSPRNGRAAQAVSNRFSAGDSHPESWRTKELRFSCHQQPGA
jgi:hypothetical protein